MRLPMSLKLHFKIVAGGFLFLRQSVGGSEVPRGFRTRETTISLLVLLLLLLLRAKQPPTSQASAHFLEASH